MRRNILSITPNPALDLGGVVDKLKPNEKSYVHDETRSAGGNAINVARILTRLSVPVVATGFLGGSTGEEINSLLKKEKVKTDFIRIAGHSRISVTVSNRSDHRQTRLSFPGPKIHVEEKAALFELVKNHENCPLVVIGGSLPLGFNAADVVKIAMLARSKGAEAIIDCPGKVMRKLVSSQPLLIKPNLDEFQELTRSNVKTLKTVKKRAYKLLNRVRFVCVSSVEGGAILVTKGGSYFGRIPNIKVRSTVGAGDSMVGAMAAQIFLGNPSGADLLRWGLAASAASLAHPGTAMGSSDEIRRLYNMTKVESV